jgi:hypothetical protein
MTITAPQQKRLQTLYGQYAARSLDAGTSREERIAWAAQRLGRQIASFGELTLDEAKKLIDGLQAAVGTKFPAPPRRRMSHRDAQKAGTEGRHDQIHTEATLAGPRDIARIQAHLTRLGWTQARLEAFLASPRGPNGGRKEVRTLGDTNRVHWALKGMKPSKEQSHAR